ncbi:hypothetical protein DACRYDRAFT_114606 [Dacryopinax primogenitus]|uniref:Uncharacterized protein n=1 Tax=Dacryopinax primogenitus (strain DJM 731) TaxID=1858805 RepID=M5G223_DACPD|nr:uncharacterized protein DACRYDRAFT_114606 [Dacryopinax primogenitus]EJU04236.1 hypothetical protein DACRYDRAFT_114606 [Dacryopinax primogenitus]
MELHRIPDTVLDIIVGNIVFISPASVPALLSSSARIRCSTLRALFSTVTIPDDTRHTLSPEDDAYIPLGDKHARAFLAEPEIYGAYIKTLKITDPVILHNENCSNNNLFLFTGGTRKEPTGLLTPVPISTHTIDLWLRCIPSLQNFIWCSTSLPPDGICETLGLHSKMLRCFAYEPASSLLVTPVEKGVGCSVTPSSLSTSPITNHICISTFTKWYTSVITLITIMLRVRVIDVVWFDEELCDAIAGLERLTSLTIGTSGTTLRDRGLQRLIGGCRSLQHLSLRDVEGRISRSFWSSVILPPSLRSFVISMSESGPHHSWTADHLYSLANLSLSHLESIRIKRVLNPIIDLGFDAPVDDVGRWPGTLIPSELAESLKGKIRVLDCDWWLWSLGDLRTVLDRCPDMEVIRIGLDVPFTKIFSLTSCLSALRNLRAISLCVPAEHAPQSPIPKDVPIWCPPSPVTPVIPHLPPTPLSSPVKRATYATYRVSESPTPPMETACTGMTDPALPSLRDIKKLAKKCQKLEILGESRGTWTIDREPLFKVNFLEPTEPDHVISNRIRWEQSVAAAGPKPELRDNHSWIESDWHREEIEKERTRRFEKQQEVEREKQRQLEKEERKRELEKLKSPSVPISPALPVSPTSAIAPTEDAHPFPLPAATRLSKQKPIQPIKEATNHGPAIPSTSRTRTSASASNVKRGGGRGRGSGWSHSARAEKPSAEAPSGRARRSSAGASRGGGRGRGRSITRATAVRVGLVL